MIFYFSGTGNSCDAAKRLAELTGDEATDMAACLKSNNLEFGLPNDAKLGIIFPVYFGGVPTPVIDFLEQAVFSFDEKPYIYAVMTNGGSAAGAGNMLAKLLDKKGIPADAVFKLTMPDNYVIMFNPDIEKAPDILSAAYKKLGSYAEKINAKAPVELEGLLGKIQTAMLYPLYKNGRATDKFNVNADCVKCGLCAQICPVEAISIEDGTPVWIKDKCSLCLGCLNRCPKQAINYGKSTVGRNRYVNPALK